MNASATKPKHPEMGTRKNCPKTPRKMRELWQQLADELNPCRGPIRSAAKWKETLANWKSQLHTRARRLKMSLIVGGPSSKPITEFEEKALSIFGSNSEQTAFISESSTPSTYPFLSLENQDASTSLLSRSARNKLTSTLIADTSKMNAEEERRRQHREIVQAIQGLTNSITELIKSNSNNVK